MADPILLLDQNRVSKLTGIPRSTMNDWERKGIYAPSHHKNLSRGATSKWYSFRDIVSLKALRRLRAVGGVSLNDIRTAGKYFSQWWSEPWSSLRVGSLSGRLIFWNPHRGAWEGYDGQQTIQEIVLSHIPREVASELPEILRRQEEEIGKIVKLRGVNGNRPVFAGTRVMVESVENMIDNGYDDDRILLEFPSLDRRDLAVARQKKRRTAS